MSHGIEKGFLPEMDEVLFKSKMIGGGQETTLELDQLLKNCQLKTLKLLLRT